MSKDFKSPAGSFAPKANCGDCGKTHPAPTVGLDNGSRGNLMPKGPGKGVPANGKRIS